MMSVSILVAAAPQAAINTKGLVGTYRVFSGRYFWA